MTKFKVGDRVTLSGVVKEISHVNGKPYTARIEGLSSWILLKDLTAQSDTTKSNTTFRDQAAIAFLAALAGAEHLTYEQLAIEALKAAVHLDEQRKKLDGVK